MPLLTTDVVGPSRVTLEEAPNVTSMLCVESITAPYASIAYTLTVSGNLPPGTTIHDATCEAFAVHARVLALLARAGTQTWSPVSLSTAT